ncbi:MAG: HNH endonuclease [Alphaproteobacteria bacterium]|nr:HNH endonuclease [Alphaproteobacteria bacterium]MBU0805354.1 HNH endonuclease [Alphaproteobacteria bacterium]MBU0873300.1 HNH endonuclease [Alphaproteobacteria bacterium]MBU1401472.1 HNH endonuclease [Alphaproteobacteria bacterium]MBU1592111.1 HNH endonuclease [Alphaproteobacteria bacterium]
MTSTTQQGPTTTPNNGETERLRQEGTSTQQTPTQLPSTKADTLTADIVRELLDYDRTTGDLIWRERDRRHFQNEQAWKTWNARYAGKAAGSRITSGYLQVTILGVRYVATYLIWVHVHGTPPTGQVDHHNRDRADNRLVNLREVTPAENQRNRSLAVNNNTGVNGVYRNGKKFRAMLTADGIRHTFGTFDTIGEAKAIIEAVAPTLGFDPTHGRDPNDPPTESITVHAENDGGEEV